MKFTKEELYEIEKTFDNKAGALIVGLGNFLSKCRNEKGTGIIKNKMISESYRCFDICRTISAKCQNERNK